jgi:hypothetical protein
MTTNKAIECIAINEFIGLKAGKDRPNFLEIWMVVVEDRIFARSWGLAERSWYNTFLTDNKGQIKCGENIYSITAIIPEDKNMLAEKINKAYLNKYNYGDNAGFASDMVTPERIEKTMEFVINA